MSELHRRIKSIEKKIPRNDKARLWLIVTFPVLASEAEKERARLAAIKEHEQAAGHELDRDSINWVECSVVCTRQELEELNRRSAQR